MTGVYSFAVALRKQIHMLAAFAPRFAKPFPRKFKRIGVADGRRE
jgi:hypothetical protein